MASAGGVSNGVMALMASAKAALINHRVMAW